MKQIKTNLRTRLSCSTLSDLMTINLLTPDVQDFDPAPAVSLWNEGSLRQRRPNFMDKANAYEKKDESDDEEELGGDEEDSDDSDDNELDEEEIEANLETFSEGD